MTSFVKSSSWTWHKPLPSSGSLRFRSPNKMNRRKLTKSEIASHMKTSWAALEKTAEYRGRLSGLPEQNGALTKIKILLSLSSGRH